MAQHSARDATWAVLDDVVPEDTVDAAGRHRPWPGQVEIHLGPPHDVGVEPLVQAYVACPHVHPDRRGHRRDRPLESPGQQWSTYRGERVVDHRPRGFRDLSTHTAFPPDCPAWMKPRTDGRPSRPRSEEHTSELQSHVNLVCRLLLEKKK